VTGSEQTVIGEDQGTRVFWGNAAAVRTFVSPDTSLGDLDPAAAATLIGAASDITLVIDAEGTVRDLVVRNDDLATDLDDSPNWIGQKLTNLVALDSRPKAAVLIREATTNAESRWRHLNHMTAGGRSVPVLYYAVQMAAGGRIVLFGRDLRAMSELQQRLVNVQQSLERDYSRMREVETRYRLLFETSTEAVLIFDVDKGRVSEANPAAATLFGADVEELIGQSLAGVIAPDSLLAVQAYLAAVRAGGREPEVQAQVAPRRRNGHSQLVHLRASLFRQGGSTLFLLRASAPVSGALALPDVSSKLLAAVESAPDGYVVTDDVGNILTANAAFLEMAQLGRASLAVGQPLDRWIGQTGVDLDVLVSNLRQRGTVRFFSTVMRAEDGGTVQVEISAVSVRNAGQSCFGYAVRNVGPRVHVSSRAAKELPRSVEQLTELIGRVALKDLVREATEVIERLSIEAALELTGDNRASAAEMLGLSRQSLYVKLRRYGLGDLNGVEGE
jgi:transcriptional regulator PpsR